MSQSAFSAFPHHNPIAQGLLTTLYDQLQAKRSLYDLLSSQQLKLKEIIKTRSQELNLDTATAEFLQQKLNLLSTQQLQADKLARTESIIENHRELHELAARKDLVLRKYQFALCQGRENIVQSAADNEEFQKFLENAKESNKTPIPLAMEQLLSGEVLARRKEALQREFQRSEEARKDEYISLSQKIQQKSAQIADYIRKAEERQVEIGRRRQERFRFEAEVVEKQRIVEENQDKAAAAWEKKQSVFEEAYNQDKQWEITTKLLLEQHKRAAECSSAQELQPIVPAKIFPPTEEGWKHRIRHYEGENDKFQREKEQIGQVNCAGKEEIDRLQQEIVRMNDDINNPAKYLAEEEAKAKKPLQISARNNNKKNANSGANRGRPANSPQRAADSSFNRRSSALTMDSELEVEENPNFSLNTGSNRFFQSNQVSNFLDFEDPVVKLVAQEQKAYEMSAPGLNSSPKWPNSLPNSSHNREIKGNSAGLHPNPVTRRLQTLRQIEQKGKVGAR
jgi:hypothetical protein